MIPINILIILGELKFFSKLNNFFNNKQNKIKYNPDTDPTVEDYLKFKEKYNLVIDELKEQSKGSKLTCTQKIISEKLKDNNCVIIYLGLFYDFEENKWTKLELLKEIVHTSIKLKIPVVILGENEPKKFIPKLNNSLSVFFNTSNYITPYHYKKRLFDNPIKLQNNKISSNPCKVNLKQMIDDIIDEYQLHNKVYQITNNKNLMF